MWDVEADWGDFADAYEGVQQYFAVNTSSEHAYYWSGDSSVWLTFTSQGYSEDFSTPGSFVELSQEWEKDGYSIQATYNLEW